MAVRKNTTVKTPLNNQLTTQLRGLRYETKAKAERIISEALRFYFAARKHSVINEDADGGRLVNVEVGGGTNLPIKMRY